MKRLGSLVLVALLCVVLSVMLTGCTPQSVPQDSTEKPVVSTGADLKNPYAEAETELSSELNVVFNLNHTGAERTTPQKVESGSVIGEEMAPEPVWDDEHSFSGWYKDQACTEKYDFSVPVTKNLVLFAGWRSDMVTVNFNYNYVGGPDMLKKQVGNGETVSSPDAPERANYAFEGWYEDAAEGDAYDFDAPVVSNKTLFAKWRLTHATVTFDVAADDAKAMEPITVAVGHTIPMPEAPVRAAYDFVSWVDAEGNAYPIDKPVTADMTAAGVVALTATWKIKTFDITFDWGEYAEGTPGQVTVEYGQAVSEPANTRSGYTLVWQLNGADYSFSSPVEGPLVLAASWTQENTGDGNLTVAFQYNYEGAPSGGVYSTASVRPRRRVSMPEQPVRDGYYFAGWYSDPEGTEKFNFSQYIRENANVYAKWLKRYTFEAEHVDFTGLAGAGYSNEVRELQMIKGDVTGTCQASNGYYVTSMYIKGAHLTFNIHSDRETDDAVIILRVQAEYVDMTINPETYVVSVNGNPVWYDELSISDPAHANDIQTNVRRPFFDYELSGRAHLNEGENEITLLVNNTVDFDAMGLHFGTLSSYAPMVDCIYVCSDTELSWEPQLTNIVN